MNETRSARLGLARPTDSNPFIIYHEITKISTAKWVAGQFELACALLLPLAFGPRLPQEPPLSVIVHACLYDGNRGPPWRLSDPPDPSPLGYPPRAAFCGDLGIPRLEQGANSSRFRYRAYWRFSMPDVTVKLAIGNFSVEVTGPSEYVDRKLEELLTRHGATPRQVTTEPRIAEVARDHGGKPLSPGEFLKKASPKNQSDIALLLAFYIEKNQETTSFTSSDLGNVAREVKRPFGNPSDVVARLTARGLMMSAGEKDGVRAYALTASGEEYVESMIEPRA
jgi:hypothetical protein